MKITIQPSRLAADKPYMNAKTGVSLSEEDIMQLVTRAVRSRLATLEDLSDSLTIEIYIDNDNRN